MSQPLPWQAVIATLADHAGLAQTDYTRKHAEPRPAHIGVVSFTVDAATQTFELAFTPDPLGNDLALVMYAHIPSTSPVSPGYSAPLAYAVSAESPSSPWQPGAEYLFAAPPFLAGQLVTATFWVFHLVSRQFSLPAYASAYVA